MSHKQVELYRQFFKLAYEHDLTLNFKTELINTDIAKVCVEAINQYNDFAAEQVNEMLEALRGRIKGYEIGREYSPVIYVKLAYWTHQLETPKLPARRISDEEYAALVDEIRRWAKRIKVDEFDVDKDFRRIRLWWD